MTTYGGHFHGSVQVCVRMITTFESEKFPIITPANPGWPILHSQRVGGVDGDSDGGVLEVGIILVTLVLLIGALDFVGNGIIFIILVSLLESLDKSGNLSTWPLTPR